MYLGWVEGKWKCHTSRNASNDTVLITGMSGAGKSVRTQMIELECAKDSATVIVLDMNFTHSQEHLFPPILAEYTQYVNHIDVVEDGISLNFFRDEYAEVSAIVLGNYYGMGLQQRAVLRKAIFMVKDVPPLGDDLATLNVTLQECGGQVLLEKMQTLLNCGVMQQCDCKIQRGKINIIDLSLLDSDVQGPLSELILAHCWMKVQKCRGDASKVIISLDEIQNLTFNRKNSPLHRMLREGRKFKMSFLLATQTLSTFSSEAIAVLNQAATHLYFRPSINEIGKIAHVIDAEKGAVWYKKLNRLKVGQCVATGDFSINGTTVSHPLILQ